MFRFWDRGTAFLGAGGNTPRVAAFDASSLEVTDEFALGPGHTPYTLALDRDRSSFAVGTRRRHVRVFRQAGCSGNPGSDTPPSIEMSAAVLSACFVPGPGIVVSDETGRCAWARTLAPPFTLESLCAGNKKICALFATGNTVVGWASDGDFVVTELSDLRQATVMHGPSPSSKYALTHLAQWNGHTLVSLTGDGSLIEIDAANRSLRVRPAHRGEGYAVAVDGSHLITIGKQDARCKVWEPGVDHPVADYEAPGDIIAATPVAGLDGALLLVDYGGNAGIWAVHGDRFHLERQLPGGDYRTVLGVPAAEMAVIRAEKVRSEVVSIIHELSDPDRRLGTQEVEYRHGRLAALGVTRVTREFRARAAHAQQDAFPEKVVEEIGIRHELMPMLPDDEGAVDSMIRYIEVLKRAWALEEGRKIYGRIRRIAPNHAVLDEASWWEEQAEAMRRGTCIIDAGTPDGMALLIECASAIEQHFIGRFVLKRFPPIPLRGAGLDLQKVREKYEAIRRDDAEMGSGLPHVSHEHVIWLSKEERCHKELLMPSDGLREGPAQVRVALAYTPDAAVFETPVIFEVGLPSRAEQFGTHNTAAMNALKGLRREYPANAAVQRLYRAFQSTVNRLVNEAINESMER